MSGRSDDLLEEVQRLIAALEAHPDAEVRQRVTALLQGIDTVHRVALTRLVGAIHGMAGDAFLNRLTADPAIRLLLMSYDLLAVDRRLLAEEALDAVRGHLHAHGVDVELTEVLGGEVFVRLHGRARSAVAEDAVRHDLEAALKAGLPGFQQLVLGERQTAPAPRLIQLTVKGARRPVYQRVLAADELGAGQMKVVEVAGQAVLVANVAGRFHAVANRCGESPLPLQFGTLDGAELRCSWHGCRYDVRSGQRLDGGADHLAVFPVAVDHGEVRVAVGVEPMTGA